MKAKLLGRIGRLGGLAAAFACVAFATGAPAASAESVECASITGSGSSLQNIAQKVVWHLQWSMLFNLMEHESLLCNQMASVTYEATSSGKGKGEWGAKTGTLVPGESFNKTTLDEFIGTDIAPEGPASTLTSEIGLMDDAGAMNGTKNAVEAIPVAQSAISVIVSLPEGCTPGTGTSASVKNMPLAEVWNTKNSLFTELVENGGLTGTSCATAPLLQARKAGSGTTAGFKRYLNDLEPSVYDACTLTAANAQSASCWPNVKPDEEGNETGGELVEKVLTTPGSIGYADLADARAKGLPAPGSWLHIAITKETGTLLFWAAILKVRNGGAALPEKGEVVSPEGTEGASNCKEAVYAEPTLVRPNEDWSKAKQTNATSGAEGVYPICTLTFDVAWEHYSLPLWGTGEKYTEAQYHTTFNYLRSIVTEGQEGTSLTELKKEHFLGLSTKVSEEAKEGVLMKLILF